MHCSINNKYVHEALTSRFLYERTISVPYMNLELTNTLSTGDGNSLTTAAGDCSVTVCRPATIISNILTWRCSITHERISQFPSPDTLLSHNFLLTFAFSIYLLICFGGRNNFKTTFL